jgi:glyoxylase-like metal-dependent hydrolase (beta-lactamase superfamily II)
LVSTVDDIIIIRSGTTLRDPEAWTSQDDDEKHLGWERLLGTYSLATVTLVKTDGLNILIDAGWERSETKTSRLALELQYHGFTPDDIDEVFITHWHEDHFLNISLFPQARIIYAGCPPLFIKKKMSIIPAENETVELCEEEKWHSGLSIISTPGHSNHDHSVVINHKGSIFLATGDSIMSKMYYHTETFYHNERMEEYIDELRTSFKRITDLTDFIIPGHDGPFYNYKKG